MPVQTFNTEIQLAMSRQELTQVAPDYANEQYFTVFIDGQPVHKVRDNHHSRDLLGIFKKHFPGRVGFVKADNFKKEQSWAKIGGRLFHIGERHINGGRRAYITVISNNRTEEDHKQRVAEVKAKLHEAGISIAKGVCTVTYVEEC